MTMHLHEWIAIGYFTYLAITTLVHRRRIFVISLTAAAAIIAIVLVARVDGALRLWWPVATILTGYWACGQTFDRPMPRIERWLQRTDDVLLRQSGALDAIGRAPRIALEYLEAVYFGCFLVVPGGLLALMAGGHADAGARYWTAVVTAELAAFGMLPWIQTRPPWALEPPGPLARRALVMGRLSRTLVDRATIRVNTFPSAHAAASLAAALAVRDTMSLTGILLIAIALSITVAAVAGRYHYAADAVAGVALGVLAWGIARG